MITATEAMCLPSAQLSDEQKQQKELLLKSIESHVRSHMEARGCDYKTNLTDLNVVICAMREIEQHGWKVQAIALNEPSRFGGQPRLAGFVLSLVPTPENARGPSLMIQ